MERLEARRKNWFEISREFQIRGNTLNSEVFSGRAPSAAFGLQGRPRSVCHDRHRLYASEVESEGRDARAVARSGVTSDTAEDDGGSDVGADGNTHCIGR
ncbi:hypothetical protein Rmet_5565 (plasmid) [Cupriavidus metallidurans CH34]|uniref:Uncharacterized protein n=1 Tax=Cupriavidus metallidurans (strain ATCC 43123 / DSM 2839 / NBRC 102507 / CH34) TaxID=266264 RepID=Q1LBQ2_CUPMC|nr:hypothetical protein Rmet_5565 [Cupriavidus metallidurans CH34]